MKKEFNLSEKGKQHLVSFDNQLRTKFSERLFFEEEDVKEAIRLIKLNPDKIDEIVGEKLK